jgi:quercetin dioxygenase-like cupin family protein
MSAVHLAPSFDAARKGRPLDDSWVRLETAQGAHPPLEKNSENITMDQQHANHSFGRFDLNEIAAAFPATAKTLLLDTYLTDEDAGSARVFRVYRGTPPHYHARSDEYLYVSSGKGTFWMGSPANAGAFAPGHFLFFKRGTVHALPEISEGPVVFLSLDTPRRDPKDIIFVNPEDGTPDSFIQGQMK